ncbi:hypothetical protein [Sinomonas gamaensis]|uniref:hypothetical protein n=1 Tax=Sinomonas gamaensis TaxID=2565624 RepID=UPI001109F2C2|nr:hypothetical protein [Sinomonas gamaensis]
MSYHSPAPYGQHYEETHFYEQDRRRMEGGKHAQNGLILGIVGAFFAVMIGWVPFIGLLGVGVGVGCGIPAILQGKKAEVYNVSGRPGVILGWVSIVAAIAWTTIYLIIIVLGAVGSSVNHGGQ